MPIKTVLTEQANTAYANAAEKQSQGVSDLEKKIFDLLGRIKLLIDQRNAFVEDPEQARPLGIDAHYQEIKELLAEIRRITKPYEILLYKVNLMVDEQERQNEFAPKFKEFGEEYIELSTQIGGLELILFLLSKILSEDTTKSD